MNRELLEQVEGLAADQLIEYAQQRADRIVRYTQGDSWDDPEEWQTEAVELAHAFYRMKRDGIVKTPT